MRFVKPVHPAVDSSISSRKGKITRLRVLALPGTASRGVLLAGGVSYSCVLGRSGIVARKREGDGGTPRARLRLRYVIQRLDRGPRIRSQLPQHTARSDEAWCDDVNDRRYNRLIRGVSAGCTERLWRQDRLYDVVVPLGWNDGPVVRGRGSAIFWHICRKEGSPTEGCIAVRPEIFRKLLSRLSRRAMMVVGPA
jgi:L,D-peptidoglycan transpeptidase YkuD (ErfK/YbiS/YcfS/YnhG family)